MASHPLLFIFYLITTLLVPLVSAVGVSLSHLSERFPQAQAERFIKSLNLLPSATESVPTDDSRGPVLVENRIYLGIKGDAGTTPEPRHIAGYFQLQNTHGTRIFYMFFESRGNKATDPLVLWMSGGPGCGSEMAVFYENGPYEVTNNLTLVWNDYGWDKVSNIIFVDQPVGTGFSYSKDVRDIRYDKEGIAEDIYSFIQAFLEAHPEYRKNDFYVSGEAYAGYYVPAVTSRIHKANQETEELKINLKGFAVGSVLMNPAIQYKAYADYALDMGLIREYDYKRINKIYPSCALSIKLCESRGTITCIASYLVCNSIVNSILALAGNINFYDVRKECSWQQVCYDFSNMEAYLNIPYVKEALGVGDRKFVSCSPIVYEAILTDWMQNLDADIPRLLNDGVKLLVYAGEYDFISNWLGNSRWVSAIDWSGKQNYAMMPSKPLMVNGKEAGVFTSYGPLNFLKVHNAGHMVPMDQPQVSLEMFYRFTQGIAFDQTLPSILRTSTSFKS